MREKACFPACRRRLQILHSPPGSLSGGRGCSYAATLGAAGARPLSSLFFFHARTEPISVSEDLTKSSCTVSCISASIFVDRKRLLTRALSIAARKSSEADFEPLLGLGNLPVKYLWGTSYKFHIFGRCTAFSTVHQFLRRLDSVPGVEPFLCASHSRIPLVALIGITNRDIDLCVDASCARHLRV